MSLNLNVLSKDCWEPEVATANALVASQLLILYRKTINSKSKDAYNLLNCSVILG
jgi:hypothetical protein